MAKTSTDTLPRAPGASHLKQRSQLERVSQTITARLLREWPCMSAFSQNMGYLHNL